MYVRMPIPVLEPIIDIYAPYTIKFPNSGTLLSAGGKISTYQY